MTVPMDCSISYCAGNIFAVAAKDSITEEPEKVNTALNRGRLFTLLVTIPIGLYFMVRWPDWSWTYAAGRHSRSRIAGVLGLATYLASHEVGFRNAARLVEAGKANRAMAHAAAGFLAFCSVVAFGWSRFRWLGTREEYERGNALDFFRTPGALIPLLASMIVFFLGAVAVAFLNRLDRCR